MEIAEAFLINAIDVQGEALLALPPMPEGGGISPLIFVPDAIAPEFRPVTGGRFAITITNTSEEPRASKTHRRIPTHRCPSVLKTSRRFCADAAAARVPACSM